MNLFKRLKGNKGPEEPPVTSFADEIREMAKREDAAAREDERSGLVAIYPELGAGRRRQRGFAELDFDDYVPELDDYEPGGEGEFLPVEEPPQRPVHMASTTPHLMRPAQVDIGARPVVAPVDFPSPRGPVDDAPQTQEEAVADGTDERAAAALVQVPGPAIGRAGGKRAGRVKTRLLGFDSSSGLGTDPFETGQTAAAAAVVRFPVGWIVVVGGPGRGASFTLFNGVSAIGRGDDQPVKLDFGDNAISRTNHAVVAYDSEQRKFFLGHGGKANIVRLNGRPVLSTEELQHNDRIRIGETTLRFLALCGADFDWSDVEGTQEGNAGRE